MTTSLFTRPIFIWVTRYRCQLECLIILIIILRVRRKLRKNLQLMLFTASTSKNDTYERFVIHNTIVNYLSKPLLFFSSYRSYFFFMENTVTGCTYVWVSTRRVIFDIVPDCAGNVVGGCTEYFYIFFSPTESTGYLEYI